MPAPDTQILINAFEAKLKGTFLGKSLEVAIKASDEDFHQPLHDFLWMMYEQLTGDAAESTRRAIGWRLADDLEAWVKPKLFNPYVDTHF